MTWECEANVMEGTKIGPHDKSKLDKYIVDIANILASYLNLSAIEPSQYMLHDWGCLTYIHGHTGTLIKYLCILSVRRPR